MSVAFVMWSRDNDSGLFLSDDPDIDRCPGCGFVRNREYIPPKFRLRKKLYDLSCTYDHIDIASQRFRDFCLHQGIEGLEFIPLPNNETYYIVRAKSILLADQERMNLELLDFCMECNRYACISGALPMYLKGVTSPLPTGIYATDMTFGSWDEREPLLIVSPDVKEMIKEHKFKGMSFSPIEA